MFNQMDRYSDEQKKIHDFIKSLHDEGYGHRKISKILNDKDIKNKRVICGVTQQFILS